MNNLKKILENRIIFLLTFGMFIISGCAHSLNLKLVRDNFYNHNDLSKEVNSLSAEFRNTISIEEIGKTYEGRSIFVIKITGNSSSHKSKPALMAIFTEHAGEHDVASLAMGIVKYLTENYGNYKKITKLLDEKEVYIIPMMNPDGVEYDLSGEVKPFTWRKNRRHAGDVGENVYGVDLNRNWGYKWDAVPEELKEQYSNPKDDYYHGENPFSENETQAVRDFILSHKNIKMFIDYHSGSAPFIQGGIGYPFAYSEKEELNSQHKGRYEEIAQKFAELVTDAKDKRKGFIVSQARDVKKNVKEYASFYLKPFIGFFLPKSTVAPGGSADWVYGELGIMSFGVEIMRDGDFFDKLPDSKNRLIENQIRGFLFLLETLSENPFDVNGT